MKGLLACNRGLAVILTLWLGSIATGLGLLADYGARPGAVGVVPAAWPMDIGLSLDPNGPTIVLGVHPRCPCTRATLDELEAVLSRVAEPPGMIAFVFEPDQPGCASDFARTSIRARLVGLGDATVVPDPGARLAGRLGMLTSGHALVYRPDGTLGFSGGLTPSRAHTGPNTGSASLELLLRGEAALRPTAAVYGCPLVKPGDEPACLPDACISKTGLEEDS